MENYEIKINLLKLEGAQIKMGKDGKNYFFVPVDEAGIYHNEKSCYLDLIAFENKNSQYGDTHFLKQSVTKEKYNSMSDEQRKQAPIIGNMKIKEGKRAVFPEPNTVQQSQSFYQSQPQNDEELPF